MSSDPNEFHLMTFDPGGTTGWAWFTLDRRAFTRPEHKVLAHVLDWSCGEFGGTEHENLEAAVALIRHNEIWDLPFQPDVEYLTEDFNLTQTKGGRVLLSPERFNAVLRWEVAKLGRTLVYQNRALRVSVTAERLKAFGFDNPMRKNGQWSKSGQSKDAFSAMQHAITRLRRLKEASRGQPWKLHDNQTANAHWDCACSRKKRCDLRHP